MHIVHTCCCWTTYRLCSCKIVRGFWDPSCPLCFLHPWRLGCRQLFCICHNYRKAFVRWFPMISHNNYSFCWGFVAYRGEDFRFSLRRFCSCTQSGPARCTLRSPLQLRQRPREGNGTPQPAGPELLAGPAWRFHLLGPQEWGDGETGGSRKMGLQWYIYVCVCVWSK